MLSYPCITVWSRPRVGYNVGYLTNFSYVVIFQVESSEMEPVQSEQDALGPADSSATSAGLFVAFVAILAR